MDHTSDRIAIKMALIGFSGAVIIYSAIAFSSKVIDGSTFWSGIRLGVWSFYSWVKLESYYFRKFLNKYGFEE